MTPDISSILELEEPEAELQNLDGKSLLELLDTMDLMRKAAQTATKLYYQQDAPKLDTPEDAKPALDEPAAETPALDEPEAEPKKQ